MAVLQGYFDWRPSPSQELLLKAALLKGQPALQAWQEYSRTLDPEQLDQGSRRLLPLLHHNLKAEHIEHPFFGQFKKTYIDAWARNKFLFAKIAPLLQACREAGVQTMVLKGGSLAIRYYRDLGLRPMSDFDFLVPTGQVHEAYALLCQAGWIPELRIPGGTIEDHISISKALHFSNPASCNLDLHWHLLKECLAPDADQDYWDAALPFELNNIPTIGLCPTDELFHTCIHAVRWNMMPPIRWVADALMILNSSAVIDWERLVGQAQKRRVSLPLKAALTYLKDHFAAPIPMETLRAVETIPYSRAETREYKFRTTPPRRGSDIPFLWVHAARIARDTGRSPGLLGFLEILQTLWGLQHAWQVPVHAARRSLRSLFKVTPG